MGAVLTTSMFSVMLFCIVPTVLYKLLIVRLHILLDER